MMNLQSYWQIIVGLLIEYFTGDEYALSVYKVIEIDLNENLNKNINGYFVEYDYCFYYCISMISLCFFYLLLENMKQGKKTYNVKT